MQYEKIKKATFLSRPNRFLAMVELDGREVVCHVKNTGRCRELLVSGATVYLCHSDNPNRKTQFDLIAVEKNGLLINMDAQAPNAVFAEWARAGKFRSDLQTFKPETVYQSSRFDFYWETSSQRGFVEVKGVTLEEHGVVRFPDAPTERGVKHIYELMNAKQAGYQAAIYFIVQLSPVRFFEPNGQTHPQFAQALQQAQAAGVELAALSCTVTPNSITIDKPVPVVL